MLGLMIRVIFYVGHVIFHWGSNRLLKKLIVGQISYAEGYSAYYTTYNSRHVCGTLSVIQINQTVMKIQQMPYFASAYE